MTESSTGPAYAIRRVVPTAFDKTVAAVRAALADEGFGVLTEIDVQATMKKKLDKDLPPYLILGACAPPMAFKALSAEPDLGVLLPCNVVIYVDGQGRTVVSAMEPEAAMSLIGNPVVDEVASEVGPRLRRVVDAVA